MTVDVDRWITARVHGPGGYTDTTLADCGLETLPGAAAFVIRCLTNPDIPSSGDVLDAIVAERVRRETETTT